MKITEHVIHDVYARYARLSPMYFSKYVKVPQFPGQKEDGPWNINRQWDGHDFPRVWCLLDFIEWTKYMDIGGHLGYTCDGDPELEFIEKRFNKKTYLPYPPYDLHDLPEMKDKFDFFLFNQTIEHLHSPDVAIANIHKNMNPGGYVFTSVPTINIPHMTPVHFGGFTPMGLLMLFAKNGFEIVRNGQWGNHKYIDLMFKNQTWPDFNDLKDEFGNVPNEQNNCCQCWVLAQKGNS